MAMCAAALPLFLDLHNVFLMHEQHARLEDLLNSFARARLVAYDAAAQDRLLLPEALCSRSDLVGVYGNALVKPPQVE